MGSFLGFAKGDHKTPLIKGVIKHNKWFHDSMFMGPYCDAFVLGIYWSWTGGIRLVDGNAESSNQSPTSSIFESAA